MPGGSGVGMTGTVWSCVLTLVSLCCCCYLVVGQSDLEPVLGAPQNIQETYCNASTGCNIPPIGDLLLGRRIFPSSTCGQLTRERYCSPVKRDECRYCYSNSSSQDEKHTAMLLTDSQVNKRREDWTWWQSEAGVENVELRIDFSSMFHLSHVTMYWKSLRPRCMVVERSIDYGRSWHVYQYFAHNCQECFGVDESELRVPKDQRGNTTIYPARCTRRYSAPEPYEGSQMVFVPLDALSVNERDDPYLQAVHNVRRLTNLRIRFTKFHLMGNDKLSDGPEVQNKYFYAIYNLVVKGNCFCSGHADQCSATDWQEQHLIKPPKDDDIPVYSNCKCQHEASGEDCSQCKPLYNDLPWRSGLLEEPNSCQRCECHGFATSCHFDEDRYAETNSTSGGVCNECSHHRQGAQCQECIDRYYFTPPASVDDPEACQLCSCLVDGAASEFCDKMGEHAGKCICKANVQGSSCAECKPGFFNLNADNPDGCEACDCNGNGTVEGSMHCHATTGQCMCKPNADGLQCDRCKDGYSDLSTQDPAGCGSCMCDVGGSLDMQCDHVTKQCPCRPNIQGLHCDQVAPGYFFNSLQRLNLYEVESGQLSPTAQRVVNETASRGLWVRTPTGGYVDLVITDIKWTMPYAVVLGLGSIGKLDEQSSGNIKVSIVADPASDNGNDAGDSPAGGETDPGSIVCHEQPDGTPGITVAMEPAIGNLVKFDHRVCLHKGTTYRLRITVASDGDGPMDVLLDTISLLPTGSSIFRNVIDDFVIDGCSLVRSNEEATMAQSAACEQHEFAISGILNNGSLACDCNEIGSSNASVCSAYNGQCDCHAGIGGRQCDICQAYHYDFSDTGCKACNCSSFGSESLVCERYDGQCTCLINTVGRTCDACRENHYPAKDLFLGIGCLACQCDAVGSVRQSCEPSADNSAGHQCSCKRGVTGALCDRCMAGYWNFTQGGCEPCGCSLAGAVGPECDLATGVCTPKANVMGDKADRCKPGYIYLQEGNPDGCMKCFCNGQSDTCHLALGYRRARIGQVLMDASGEDMWVVAEQTSGSAPFETVARPGQVVTFVAPSIYLGDKRTAFSQALTFALSTAGNHSHAAISVRLERRAMPPRVLYYPVHMPVQDNGSDFEVRFLRHGWKVDDPTGPMAQDSDLRETLANLSSLEILVSISQDAPDRQYTVGMTQASMTYAVRQGPYQEESGSEDTSSTALGSGEEAAFFEASLAIFYGDAPWVEACSCPPPYRGENCENCAPGYTREPSFGTEFDMCLRCFDACEQLSTDHCDANSGECRGCANNTQGTYCQQCNPLHYQRQRFQGCLECPCPGGGVQFATTCQPSGPVSVVCSCIQGHTGEDCAQCSAGYYGDPVVSREVCEPCHCNNNTDPGVLDFCDRQSGQCLDCLYNTGGATCGRCADGYYGDALRRTCRPCECDVDGSNSSVCHYETGQCRCRPNTINKRCNECAPHHYDLASGEGCKACNCCSSGSHMQQCDLITGNCSCLPGISGRQCCECHDEFWDFPRESFDDVPSQIAGCKACNCSTGGSLSQVCDKDTGICRCQPTSTGVKCDSCSAGTYGPPDCVHCGQCFDDWNKTVLDMALHIRQTGMRAQLLREGGFAGTYSETLQAIQRELEFASRYLDASYLNETLVEAVNLQLAKLEEDIQRISDDVSIAKNAALEQSSKAAQISRHLVDVNASVLRDVEQHIQELSSTLQGYMPVPYVDLSVAENASASSTNSITRLSQLYLPVSEGGQHLARTLRQLNIINSTLSSPEYMAMFGQNQEKFEELQARIRAALDTLGDLDKSMCGTDSRDGADGCAPGSAGCGGLRCAVCLGDHSCNSAAGNSSKAIQLADATLAAVAERTQDIQALVDSIAVMSRNVTATRTPVEQAQQFASNLADTSSDVSASASERKDTIEELQSSAAGNRAAMQALLVVLRQRLATTLSDNSTEMDKLVADISTLLAGISASEVDTIMSDTESSLSLAKTLFDNATAVDAEAQAALLAALQLETVLVQAAAIQEDAMLLVRQLNITANETEHTHEAARASLARSVQLRTAAQADLSTAFNILNDVEELHEETGQELDTIQASQTLLREDSRNVTQMAGDLASRSSQVLGVLLDADAAINQRLQLSLDLVNRTDTARQEMDTYRMRAEVVYNSTVEHRRTLTRMDGEVTQLLADLDAAVDSIRRKDEFQIRCQFPAPEP
ncbi:laminin subunit beta-2-like [Sycon ciliatum]|uniref:laminin subunit beta-2-like n=1 Tax=Sycon ciliatum TaxID=27933 RepID=UPI0020AC4385|eukprot:scpid4527/ scgid23872/ Laminin subunit beta-1; Laminin B1 chain; Laminin-1 subunit beta; Laminin-10 subunit beta; Laminin-12 subunit beta; Laminin-2 subunit beta; Laminin-6 subunit beta; Laminin-8 subunit beta